MPQGYIKEATYQFSDRYLHGKWSNCWVLQSGVLVVFDIMDAPRIHQGSYVSIFQSLPSWKVVQLLGQGWTNKTFFHGMQLYRYRCVICYLSITAVADGICITQFMNGPLVLNFIWEMSDQDHLHFLLDHFAIFS